jgi:hypothetical protein
MYKLFEHVFSFLLGIDLEAEYLGHMVAAFNLLSKTSSLKTSQLIHMQKPGLRTNDIDRIVKFGTHSDNFRETFVGSSVSTGDSCGAGRLVSAGFPAIPKTRVIGVHLHANAVALFLALSLSAFPLMTWDECQQWGGGLNFFSNCATLFFQ